MFVAANISADAFFVFHTKMHDQLKGRLAPAQLAPFCQSRTTKFAEELDKKFKVQSKMHWFSLKFSDHFLETEFIKEFEKEAQRLAKIHVFSALIAVIVIGLMYRVITGFLDI